MQCIVRSFDVAILSETDYQHISGTRVAFDFVETPSTLMELFANNSHVLGFGRHFRTNEPISKEMLDRALNAKNLSKTLERSRQLLLSKLDQIYHSEAVFDQNFNTSKVLKTLEDATLIKHVPETHWETQFSHLFSYGCNYYSYAWSSNLAETIYKQLFDQKDWRAGGEIVKNELLKWGGGRDPWIGLDKIAEQELKT
jgi:intermediate peptidase